MREQQEVRGNSSTLKSSDEHPSRYEGGMEEEVKKRWRKKTDGGDYEGGEKTPQLFGALTNIHYKFRDEGDELKRWRTMKDKRRSFITI